MSYEVIIHLKNIYPYKGDTAYDKFADVIIKFYTILRQVYVHYQSKKFEHAFRATGFTCIYNNDLSQLKKIIKKGSSGLEDDVIDDLIGKLDDGARLIKKKGYISEYEMDELNISKSNKQEKGKYELIRYGSHNIALKSQRTVIINHVLYQQQHNLELEQWKNDNKIMIQKKTKEKRISRKIGVKLDGFEEQKDKDMIINLVETSDKAKLEFDVMQGNWKHYKEN